MAMAGETICTGAPTSCDECGAEPLHDLRLGAVKGPAAIYTYCNCGPYSRESVYIESEQRARLIVEACRRAVNAAGGLTAVEVLYVARIIEAFKVNR